MSLKQIPVLDGKFRELGTWVEGTPAYQVLFELRQQLHLLPDEGQLYRNGVEMRSDEKLKDEKCHYGLVGVAGGPSALHILCSHHGLKQQHDDRQDALHLKTDLKPTS